MLDTMISFSKVGIRVREKPQQSDPLLKKSSPYHISFYTATVTYIFWFPEAKETGLRAMHLIFSSLPVSA